MLGEVDPAAGGDGVVGAGGYVGWKWTQDQYYVGADGEGVAVYRGLNQSLAGLSLSSVYEQHDDIELKFLPTYQRTQVTKTIQVYCKVDNIFDNRLCDLRHLPRHDSRAQLHQWLQSLHRPALAEPGKAAGLLCRLAGDVLEPRAKVLPLDPRAPSRL